MSVDKSLKQNQKVFIRAFYYNSPIMISLNVPLMLYLILSTVTLLTVAFKLLGITCFCLYKLVINKL